MKKADVIIGANFGDEGKGLVTDFCASDFGEDAVVVRFNGGAQAGHTVTTPEGARHVFSHFGSGSFLGAQTFLSRFFVCHPMLFRKEHALLAKKTPALRVQADARAPVTTPYDMMINQMAEESRGASRHGSCGMGFGETLERTEMNPFGLCYADLKGTDIKQQLRQIRDNWVPQRLQKLGIQKISETWRERLHSDEIIDAWRKDVAFFLSETKEAPVGALAAFEHGLVFEGAQGLLLDQHRGAFPHVTRSNTGIRNVLALSGEAALDHLRVHYVTRAYLTRHGAGPMDNELPAKPYAGIHDATNILNDWQGALRFALIDADLLARSIHTDLADAKGGKVGVDPVLAVTCLDQLEAKASLCMNGHEKSCATDELPQLLQDHVGIPGLVTSHGPSRETLKRY